MFASTNMIFVKLFAGNMSLYFSDASIVNKASLLMNNLPPDIIGVIVGYVDDSLGLAILSEVSKIFADIVKERCTRPFRMDLKLLQTDLLLLWALQHEFTVAEQVFPQLVRDRNVDMIERLLKHGFKCEEYILCMAIEQGDLGLVKKILLNGGPMCNAAGYWVASTGHLHIIQWLDANGYVKFKYSGDLREAWKEKHYYLYYWLIANGWPNIR